VCFGEQLGDHCYNIGREGGKDIAAALEKNETLKTLRQVAVLRKSRHCAVFVIELEKTAKGLLRFGEKATLTT